LAAVEEIGLENLGLTEIPAELAWVESDLHALEMAWSFNIGQESWKADDIKYLSSLLGGRDPDDVLGGMSPQMRRAAQVLADAEPGLTERELAAEAGVSKTTARSVREELGEPNAHEVKRDRIAKAIAENPDASNRKIAGIAGVDHHTVAVHVGNLVGPADQIPHPDSEPDPPAKPTRPKKPKGPERSWRVKWHGDWSLKAARIAAKLKREPFIARKVFEELDAWRGWDDSPQEEDDETEPATRRPHVLRLNSKDAA
jgi:hypothetical protein